MEGVLGTILDNVARCLQVLGVVAHTEDLWRGGDRRYDPLQVLQAQWSWAAGLLGRAGWVPRGSEPADEVVSPGVESVRLMAALALERQGR
jgi:hypothetical protein